MMPLSVESRLLAWENSNLHNKENLMSAQKKTLAGETLKCHTVMISQCMCKRGTQRTEMYKFIFNLFTKMGFSELRIR